MADSAYQVLRNQRTWMAAERGSGRCLGGFGSNFYRPWVFPLYTPAGQTVIQEFAFDHPFHNGVFVGQNPVEHVGGVVNFWAAPPRRSHDDALFVGVGRMDAPLDPEVELLPDGVRFRLACAWRDEHERPVLAEERAVAFYAVGDATICEMASVKTATSGPLRFPRTKFGSIGIRVEPRLLPPLGGVVVADRGRRGTAAVVHEQDAAFVAFERGDGRFGVLMSLPDGDAAGPWFVRDYGMALYNPTWARAIDLVEGETWRLALRVVAYDGPVDDARAAAWVGPPARV